jgi:hypothetical protein
VSSTDGSADSVYRKEPSVAHEYVLSWCIKRLRSSYSWGVYEEIVEETVSNITQLPYPWSTKDYPGFPDTDYRENMTIHSPSDSQEGPECGLSNNTFLSFVVLLDEILPS